MYLFSFDRLGCDRDNDRNNDRDNNRDNDRDVAIGSTASDWQIVYIPLSVIHP